MTPQELKSSILQLAIQGKLVEQRPEEGTGEELFEQIQAEKRKFIKAGTIKKEKPLPEITEDEIPFEIPESWKWVRIGQVFNLQAGKNIMASDIYEEWADEHQYPCYGGNGRRGYVSNYNREGFYALIGRQGALCGNVNLANGKFYATEHAVVVDHFSFTDVLWGAWFLTALNLNQYATATAQPGLAVANIIKVLIPLPSLAEQKRIVAKIEELLPLIDRYEKAWSRLEDFNKRFPVDMQKSILQMAIQGKLVEQRSEEGTGEELYQQIQAEKQKLIKEGKIKKEKPLPEISEDEIPFDIPESWKWCRLSEICNVTDGTHQTPHYVEKGRPFISAQNIKPYRFMPEIYRCVSEEDYLNYNKNVSPEKGDILMTRVGAMIGEAAIINVDMEFSIYVSLTLIKCYQKNFDMSYLLHVLNSPHGRKLAEKKTLGKSASQGNLNLVFIREFLIPLPPLAEQKRIVAKLEEILPLCDKLK